MNQLAFSLFDSSSSSSSSAGPAEAPTANHVVALGPKAAAQRAARKDGSNDAGQDQLLGTLLWFTISNAVRLTSRTMMDAIEAASMSPELLMPREPSAAAALTRAAEDAEIKGARLTHDRQGDELDTDHYANILCRTTGRGVKQVVTELLKDKGDGKKKRLFYQPLANAWVEDDGELKIERLHTDNLLPPEIESLKRLRAYFAFEKGRHDGEKVRAVMGRAFSLANAIPLRDSGAMYFIPRTSGASAGNILAFVGEVRERAEDSLKRKARASTAFSVPLVDREEYREILEDSLEAHMKKEARSLIAEMTTTLKSDSGITKKRQQRFVERVKSLKESVASYEELLEMEATEARSNLEVAMKQARSLLLSSIAERD